ncbi:MAG: HAMP domain-containing histidine kinase [Eubacterium sp.]|nr:HAMP domain-containing histidine kinase [Eubacterium sp.]MDD7210510.1 HAMP domain-containing sensor histidine kinase [Lachnospiraceae bacterium]MDY5497374.1 HAMP domain-containing sensor histidine kinase [Anaerobutyricum sp.]
MKVRRFKSFRFKMVMYMFFSVVATAITEGLIFAGIYLYETEIIAGEYKRVWGASGQGRMSLGTFTMSQSAALDACVVAVFTMLLLMIYFILISHNFVSYVREIISGVERMKSGEFTEEIPVRGEDEFSEIAGSINEMRQNLYETLESRKDAERTKDELITNVAHDLRTPLTSILGYLDLLTQGDFLTDEQKQKYLGIVSSKARQLETLVKDLFDYTRYDKNKVKIKKEILDLNLFVPQLVDEFYPSFMDHQLECRTDFYEGALNIEGNGELLARAIGNLVSNAIKYGADGKLVEVKTGINDGRAYVAIVNYGKIIPAEDLEKIFDKFYRVENSRSLKTGGTGLGLAIAKNIVTLHDGVIWATSDEEGTRFQIELPLVKSRTGRSGK